jgi:transposase
MATIAAMRCNPVIRAFAQRLRAAGKPSKVVIVACMRKLLSLLNAMVRHGLAWDQLEVVKKLTTAH